jgi:hypothetical protein
MLTRAGGTFLLAGVGAYAGAAAWPGPALLIRIDVESMTAATPIMPEGP